MNGIVRIFFDYLRTQDELIIYGCGNNGKLLQWLFQQCNVKVDYWCDGNNSFWGSDINNVRCISPEQLEKHRQAVVVVSMIKYEEVLPKLERMGFAQIFTWDDMKNLQTELCGDKELQRKYHQWRLEQLPDLKAILEKNSRFKDIHSKERCFIIGNGPSVRQQKLSMLQDEVVFTVNQMAKNPQFREIRTKYHLWADPNFFKTEMTCEGDYQLLQVMKQLPEETECFFPYDSAAGYINKFELYKYINVNYYNPAEFVGIDEEIDFTQFVRSGYTVVQYAIRLAIYMGFKEIYILGCECTTILNVINARTSQYITETHAYDIDEKEKERARSMYFSLPMQEYYKSELGVLTEYHLLGKYCKRRGVKLINCTPGGLLEEFERADYERVVCDL